VPIFTKGSEFEANKMVGVPQGLRHKLLIPLSKPTAVVDALNHMSYSALSCLLVLPKHLCDDFRKLEINVVKKR